MVSKSKEVINIDVAKALAQLGISAPKFMLNNQAKQPEWAWNQSETLMKVEFVKVLKSVNRQESGKLNQL